MQWCNRTKLLFPVVSSLCFLYFTLDFRNHLCLSSVAQDIQNSFHIGICVFLQFAVGVALVHIVVVTQCLCSCFEGFISRGRFLNCLKIFFDLWITLRHSFLQIISTAVQTCMSPNPTYLLTLRVIVEGKVIPISLVGLFVWLNFINCVLMDATFWRSNLSSDLNLIWNNIIIQKHSSSCKYKDCNFLPNIFCFLTELLNVGRNARGVGEHYSNCRWAPF